MRFDFRYTGLRVRDLDRAVAFYTKVLGLSLLHRSRVPATKGELAVVGREGSDHVLELNWYADDSPAAGPYREGDELDHLAFEVDDLPKALEQLERQGHPAVSELRESKNALWTYVRDPDGVWIELFQHRAKSAKSP